MDRVFLAVDLGASSGRVVAGLYDGRKLQLQDIHRFGNGPVHAAGTMYWDVLRLWSEIQDGLRRARQQVGEQVASVAVDTWGVDFGLLDRDDQLIGNPVHYRDARTQGMMVEAFQTVSREEIFSHTGLQFMELNTLYQMVAMRRANSAMLEHAKTFLMMPDLFHWLLTHEKSNEMTNASTTQFYNPIEQSWSAELLRSFDLREDIFLPVSPPGTVLGELAPSVVQQTGLRNVRVVLPGTHDTASAVMAVPTTETPSDKPNWCYISSGTWSLMGVEVSRPVINSECSRLNFTNEGGVEGTTRLLKNIAGLWIVQECRRIWQQEGHEYSWDKLVQLASHEAPRVAIIDPDHADFLAPAHMPRAIVEFCQRTGQTAPTTHGGIIRVALESLALRYRQVLGWLQHLTDGHIDVIHIVGGGTQNRLLCQMAADACQRRVVSGPIEATAIGNILMQTVASGEVRSIAEARQLIRASFPVEEYLPDTSPETRESWDGAFGRFEKMVQA